MQLVIFYLYLVFHTCTARFDVTENLKKVWILDITKQSLCWKIKIAYKCTTMTTVHPVKTFSWYV